MSLREKHGLIGVEDAESASRRRARVTAAYVRSFLHANGSVRSAALNAADLALAIDRFYQTGVVELFRKEEAVEPDLGLSTA